VFLEAGKAQPRTLANAFLEPVDTRGNMIETSYQAIAAFLKEFDRMYGHPASEQRTHAGMHTGTTFGEASHTLDEVAMWAQQRVIE